MTALFIVDDWGVNADIRRTEYEEYSTEAARDDPDTFLSFEAAKAELLARLNEQLREISIAFHRIDKLEEKDLHNERRAESYTLHRGTAPLLSPADDMTRREDYFEGYSDEDPCDHTSPGSKGP